MKHLLNDLSSEEKNRILEQYDNSLIVETSKFNKLMKSKLGNVKPLVEFDPNKLVQQFNSDSHYPYRSWEDEFPFPEQKKNMAPIKNVFDMETGKFIGTHQYGVGFEPNKIGEEMGYEPNKTSIPNGTRMEKDEFEEFED